MFPSPSPLLALLLAALALFVATRSQLPSLALAGALQGAERATRWQKPWEAGASFMAYDPAGDVLTPVHSSCDYLKPPADGLEHLIINFQPDNEYAAGGFTSVGLAAHATGALSVLELSEIVHVAAEASKSGLVYVWNRATSKLQAFRIGALDGNAAAAGPLTEVAAGVDLSTDRVTLHIYGKRATS
ncbi:MAG: hypothetical protein IPK67_18700 [Planctomycetes bacterium]|nr:hypothetical protein [Planctomycetota bacterium]